MPLLSVLIALSLERLAQIETSWRQPQGWVALSDPLRDFLVSRGSYWDGLAGLGVLLFIPTFLVSLVVDTFDGLFFGLLELGFGVAVLMMCLGPMNAVRAARGLEEALHSDDAPGALHHLRDLTGEEPQIANRNCSVQGAHALLSGSGERMFNVLFWFLLLGPVGAVLYRVASLLTQSPEENGLREAALQVRSGLAWVPVRLLAASFALAGRFDGVLDAWRNHEHQCAEGEAPSGEGLLLCTGMAALGLDAAQEGGQQNRDDSVETEWSGLESQAMDEDEFHLGDDEDSGILVAAQGLLDRAMLIWVGIMLLVGLSLLAS